MSVDMELLSGELDASTVNSTEEPGVGNGALNQENSEVTDDFSTSPRCESGPRGTQYLDKDRLTSLCSSLWRTWFIKEFVMMFRLSLPLVSQRSRLKEKH